MANPPQPHHHLLKLPLEILGEILQHILIAGSARPPAIPVTENEVKNSKRYVVGYPVLRICRLMICIGNEAFFKEHTLTTSSPSNSWHIAYAIKNLRVWQRRLIQKVSLQIDWGEELWEKFPSVAVALRELKALIQLELFFVSKVDKGDGKLDMTWAARMEIREAKPRVERGWRREGKAAERMLEAEKKMFWDLVCALKALRIFRLVNFVDEDFAREVELWVIMRSAGTRKGGPSGWLDAIYPPGGTELNPEPYGAWSKGLENDW